MKKTKKVLLAALACVAVAMSASAFTACSTTNEEEKPSVHTHTSGSWVSTDAAQHYKFCTDENCTNPTEKLDAAMHDTDGKDGACSVCGYKAQTATPVEHTHTWSAWAVTGENKPTTTVKGKATRTCSGAGKCDGEKEHTLPVLTSTDYTQSGDTATCTAAGTVTYTYDKDGVNVAFTVVSSVKAHVVASVKKKDATCTENGNIAHYKCNDCGHLFSDAAGKTQITEASVVATAPGHDWSWTKNSTTHSATCTHGDATIAEENHDTDVVGETCKCGYTIPEPGHVHSIASVEKKDATCTENGNIAHYKCESCGLLFSDEAGKTQITDTTVVIPALNHAYGEPTYEWNEDKTKCTATRVCGRNAKHTETETVDTTDAVTVAATCSGNGSMTVTATFVNTAFATQTETVVLTALDHAYGAPTYEWNADKTQCTATRVCGSNAEHKETETVDATEAVTTAVTCTKDGVKTKTATFVNSAFAKQTETVMITALEHDWSWTKNSTTHSATCTRGDATIAEENHDTDVVGETCKCGYTIPEPEHVHSIASVEKKDATCTENGNIAHYKCEGCGLLFSDEAGENGITDTTVVIPALNHAYGEPTYEWNEDKTKCTATRVCGRNAKHTETETVAATETVTKEVTCTEDGSKTMTATFTNTAFAEQTETVVLKNKLNMTMYNGSTEALNVSYALPGGAALTLQNWKYYHCDGCGKNYSLDTAYTTDVARHVEANEITLTNKAYVTLGSLIYCNGPARLDTNIIYCANGKGGVLFKATESGTYKFSADAATALLGVGYFGVEETGTTPSQVYKNSAWDKTATKFTHFTRNPQLMNTKNVYVDIQAGDVVAVAYTLPTGSKIHAINIQKVNAAEVGCQMHVAAYDMSEFNAAGGTIVKKCAVCGETQAEQGSVTYTKGEAVAESNASAPVTLINDTLLVKTSAATGTYYSFTPDATGDYEITFDVITGNALTLQQIKCGEDVAGTYNSSTKKFTFESAYNNKTIKVDSTATGVSVILRVDESYLNKQFTFNFDVAKASADNPAGITSEISMGIPNFITESANTVTITAGDDFHDAYFFISETDKMYSMTVPEGVEVLMNGNDFIKFSGARQVNFHANAGVRITFAFKNGTTLGDITVTIGDPIEMHYDKITLTESQPELSLPSKTVVDGVTSGGVAILEVGDIVEGKYTLTIKLSKTLTRGAYVCFGKNTSDIYNNYFLPSSSVRTDEESAAQAYCFTGNFSTGTVNDAPYTQTYADDGTWTITLDLRQGDILVFANGALNDGQLAVSMAKAEA